MSTGLARDTNSILHPPPSLFLSLCHRMVALLAFDMVVSAVCDLRTLFGQICKLLHCILLSSLLLHAEHNCAASAVSCVLVKEKSPGKNF